MPHTQVEDEHCMEVKGEWSSSVTAQIVVRLQSYLFMKKDFLYVLIVCAFYLGFGYVFWLN